MQTKEEILKEYKEKYKNICSFQHSPDGKSFAFIAQKEN
jgi:hypothetical protein